MAKQETTNIIHHLLPYLEDANIPIINIKVDVATKKTNPLRGDVWISKEPFSSHLWEKNIVALIEAKHKDTTVGSKDWSEAMQHGKDKATLQGLSYYIVTNTKTSWKYYRAADSKEITIDGDYPHKMLGIYDLGLIATQISPTNSNVTKQNRVQELFYSEKDFLAALYQIKNVYRACSIDKVDSKITTTITFVVLKYITEQEAIHRTLDSNVMLWNDWRDINLDRDIKATIEDVQKSTAYAGVAKYLSIDPSITAENCKAIKEELKKFQISGCNFDLYGAVYESFADKNVKSDFGQYYTRRHISRFLSELLLRNELIPRNLEVCDLACGTGGFLTEAYRILLRNYTASGHLTEDVNEQLKYNTFFGFDIKEQNISLSRINMCLAGDGHTNISLTPDSLMTVKSNQYDYILTNVPYGLYKGGVSLDNFFYAKTKRDEMLFLEKVVQSLKYGGKAVVIVPDGILESPSLEDYRIKFLNEVKVEAVVSLHKFVFRPYTTEKTFALIFQKRQKDQISKKLNYEIFMYILENDGYQKGDKRYPVREDNIPDLLANYKGKKTQAPSTHVNIDQLNDKNFFNLTPEFHLNYYESEYMDVQFDEYKANIEKLKRLNEILENPFYEA